MIYFFYLKGGESMEIVWTCTEADDGRVVKDIARKKLHLSGALWRRIKLIREFPNGAIRLW